MSFLDICRIRCRPRPEDRFSSTICMCGKARRGRAPARGAGLQTWVGGRGWARAGSHRAATEGLPLGVGGAGRVWAGGRGQGAVCARRRNASSGEARRGGVGGSCVLRAPAGRAGRWTDRAGRGGGGGPRAPLWLWPVRGKKYTAHIGSRRFGARCRPLGSVITAPRQVRRAARTCSGGRRATTRTRGRGSRGGPCAAGRPT